jgi:predicted aspartyl protease
VVVWTVGSDGAPLPVPRAEVSLNGHSADVMLDTGASQHFLLRAAAWAYDVPSTPFASSASDAHGARFDVELATNASLRVPGRPFSLPSNIFLMDSRPLWARGLVGAIAPQLLAPPGHATILDLSAGRMEVVSLYDLERGDRLVNATVCRAGNDPRDGWRYVVPARVAGRWVMLLLDTGAQASAIYDRAALAPTLASSASRAVQVAGAASVARMRVVEGVPLTVGGASLEVRVTVGPGDPQCGEEGLLGFDVLRYCRIVLRRDGAALRCQSDPPVDSRAPERHGEPMILASVDADAACGRSAAELRPIVLGAVPFRYRSAVDAYVALREDAGAHATRIEHACQDSGYLEARVREPLLERRGSHVALRFHVDEGRRFTVGRVMVSLLTDSGPQRLSASHFPWLHTRAGQPYRRADVNDDARTLVAALTARGAHVAEAASGRNENADATVDVYFALALTGGIPP